jgi:DNA (cytosine-5)-methyltransferase 1
MGVPQRRERTFFIANRLEKKIKLEFFEEQIPVGIAINGILSKKYKPCSEMSRPLWEKTEPGKSFSSVHKKGSYFNSFKCCEKSVAPTVIASASASASGLYHWKEPRHLSSEEYRHLQTFPNDYNPLDHEPIYIMGMSVPPFMMQRIADQIAIQFFGV